MSLLDGQTIINKIVANANQETLNAFYDVRAVDDLPKFIPHYPIFIIVNTHTKNLPGQHWLVIFIDKYKHGEIFDSLALPVSYYIGRWLNQFTRKWKRNNLAYQHPLTTSCGAFAIYYVLKRLNTSCQERVLKTFKDNTFMNEMIVMNFYHSLK